MILLLAQILAAVVALFHLGILVMEMILWETPRVRSIFGTSREFAAATRTLAANQGLYNGFLAAGLLWSLAQGEAGQSALAFFLACVAIAGIFGGATVARRIFLVQGLPAIVALAALVLAGLNG